MWRFYFLLPLSPTTMNYSLLYCPIYGKTPSTSPIQIITLKKKKVPQLRRQHLDYLYPDLQQHRNQVRRQHSLAELHLRHLLCLTSTLTIYIHTLNQTSCNLYSNLDRANATQLPLMNPTSSQDYMYEDTPRKQRQQPTIYIFYQNHTFTLHSQGVSSTPDHIVTIYLYPRCYGRPYSITHRQKGSKRPPRQNRRHSRRKRYSRLSQNHTIASLYR